MKDLEKIFKESLSNHEVPYDANAWTALSSKMAIKPKPFYKKGWFYGAVAGAAVIIVGTTYFTSNNEVDSNEITAKKEIKNNTKNGITSNELKEVIALNQESDNVAVKQEAITEKTIDNNIHTNEVITGDLIMIPLEVKNDETHVSEITTNELAVVENEPTLIALNASFELRKKTVCLGSSIFIHLPEQISSIEEVLTIDGKSFPIHQDERVVEYKTEKSGSIDVNYMVSRKNRKESISQVKQVTVHNMDQADFHYTTTTEKGMPLTEFSTTSKNAVWKIDDKVVSKSSTFKYLFMNKGTYQVSLEVQNENGCESTTNEMVHVESNYKLFAETGLILGSSDQRLNSFMPFALEEMDQPEFMLSVMDARTGELLFTSNDVSYKWDGTNRTTGNKLEAGSIVFWTVVIKGNKYITGPIKGDVTIQN
jgi:PKD repeat protein